MSNSFTRTFRGAVCAGVATIALAPSLAFAQDAAPADEAPSDEIVVTGTLIRGTTPVGSNAITLGQERLQETGATSSNELLASIPQVTNYFNRVPLSDLAIAVNQMQISRPNIRNVSPNNAASSATLILVDGHRIATAGISQASVDPDLIPTGAIERVEVVTEGGSSLYGADAVAGVINFITRKRFNGVKVEGHYGFADDYWQADASITAGKAWETGSAYISYSFTKNSALYGRDRDFIRNLDYTSQPYRGRDLTCTPANLAVNMVYVPAAYTLSSTNYAAPGFTANTANRCDGSDDSTAIPRAERHGVFAGLTQELGDRTSVDVRAYYGQRKTLQTSTLRGTVTLGANNFFVKPILDAKGIILGDLGGGLANQASASFSLEPIYGKDSQRSSTFIKEWGVNAEIKHNLSDDWQLRGLINWSQSDSRFNLTGINTARLNAAGAGTTAATAINPFDLTQTSRALLDDLIDNEIAGQAKDSLFNARLIAEGKLFSLPGGDVRLAAGYEYMHDSYQQRYQSDIRIGTLGNYAFSPYSRDVHSLFGELRIPLVGPDNGMDGLRSLVVSASGRYDHYSDFGDTFNPKIGVTYKPVEGFAIRGNWGTSFTAPTPLDQLGSQRNTISSFGFVAFTRPGETPAGGSYTIALQGSQANLQPQTANTWSVGVDLDPARGLHASVSYYEVKFKNILATPTPGTGIFTDFPGNIWTNPSGLSESLLRQLVGNVAGGQDVVTALVNAGTPVYEFVDFRVGNFGVVNVKGVDFALNYNHPTWFGSVDFNVNGNIPFARTTQASPTSVVSNQLTLNNPKLYLQASLGADIGAFRAQATWNHTGGYNITPTNSVPVQDHVSAFNTVDLFFKYDVPSENKLFRNLSFTLNVKNLFNQDPPLLLRNEQGDAGYANGFTFGRMFILGVSKQF